jgi:hypothetical protein
MPPPAPLRVKEPSKYMLEMLLSDWGGEGAAESWSIQPQNPPGPKT